MTKEIGKTKDMSQEKYVETVIPLVPKIIVQASTEGEPLKKINFGTTKKKPEDLIRLFYTDKNNKPIIYPVDSFESDTGWIEMIHGKDDSSFRRNITFNVNTSQNLIDKTIEFIRDNCNPGTTKEHYGWMSYGDEDNLMMYTIKTSAK